MKDAMGVEEIGEVSVKEMTLEKKLSILLILIIFGLGFIFVASGYLFTTDRSYINQFPNLNDIFLKRELYYLAAGTLMMIAGAFFSTRLLISARSE